MPEGLSRRVGPLPLWGWIVVGLVGYLVWRRRTEPGYFPRASYPIGGGGGGQVGGGFRSFLGMGGGGGDDLTSEPMIVGASAAERPALPSPIIAGGVDTGFGSYSGGTANYPKTPGGGTTVQVVPIGTQGGSPYGGGGR